MPFNLNSSNSKQSLKGVVLGITISLFFFLLFLYLSFILAWTEPVQLPPQGNVPVPINTGSTPQTKTGNLTINNVQIGTSTLTQDSPGEGSLQNVNMIVGYNDLHLRDSSSNNASIYLDQTNKAVKLYTQGSERLIIDQNGNVGIGTTTPSAKLEIRGDIKLSGANPTYRITNVATPINDSDVATKGYVDAAGGGGGCVGGLCPSLPVGYYIGYDWDGDGYTMLTGDCDETCPTCYPGSTSSTTAPDGKDQDCDGEIDEESPFTHVILAETPDKYAYEVCKEWDPNAECLSVGTDAEGTNGKIYYLRNLGIITDCRIENNRGCDDYIGPSSSIRLGCEGHYVPWTYVRCQIKRYH